MKTHYGEYQMGYRCSLCGHSYAITFLRDKLDCCPKCGDMDHMERTPGRWLYEDHFFTGIQAVEFVAKGYEK